MSPRFVIGQVVVTTMLIGAFNAYLEGGHWRIVGAASVGVAVAEIYFAIFAAVRQGRA